MQFGPGDAKAMLVGQLEQRLRALLALGVAALAELRRVDQRALETVLRGLPERVGNRRRRDDGQREIDRLGDRREIGMDRPAPHLAALRIDQIQSGREAGILEVIIDFLGPAAAA